MTRWAAAALLLVSTAAEAPENENDIPMIITIFYCAKSWQDFAFAPYEERWGNTTLRYIPRDCRLGSVSLRDA